MAKQVDVIKKFVDVLTKTSKTGTDAVDEAMKAVGAGNYSALLSKFKSEVNTDDTLEQICGVRINNKDTGAITGSDAGGSTTKTAESIIPEKAAAKELTNAEYESFTKNGLTVNVVYDTSNVGSDFNYDKDNYLAKQKLAVRALYNWWIPESLDLINESLGINFTDGRANTNEITVKFSQDSYSYIEIDTDYDLGRADSVTLTINSNLIKGLTASDKSGTISGNKGFVSGYVSGSWSWNSNSYAYYVDQLVLYALTKITLDANVSYVDKLPGAIRFGLPEIVGGFDDASSYKSDFYYSSYTQRYGYTLMRYLAKNYTVDTLPAGLSYNADKTVLTASTAFTGSKIELSDFAESVKTVNASALSQAVKITGNALNNSIVGGTGADTLAGASGNDSLTGGAGDDIFIYSAGKDFITDYAVGDKISIASGTLSKASLSGSDVVLTIGSGSLTVKNAKDKKITWIDTAGKEASTLLGGTPTSTTLNITNSTKSPVTLAKTYKNADASTRTTAVKITGNTEANSIIGGTGADTLWGGTGNDTLKGGNGNDVFIYSAGKDVITDYASGDKISLGAAVSKSTVSGSDVVFTIGSGSLTVKNGKGKSLSMIDSAGKSYTTVVGTAATATTLKITNSTKSPVTLAKTYKNADASTRTTAVKITGNTEANSIIGGKGNDTLDGGTGNDTLKGGNGNDVFIYSAGKDVITDYASGDKISLGAAVSKSTVSGSDVVFTVGTGSLTVKNGKGKSLSMIDSKGKSYTTVVGTAATATLTVSNSTKSPIKLESKYKTADASSRTTAVKITGNAEANSIIGGKGNDTLDGGKGNDSLWGNAGKDVFLYSDGEGKDIIYGFANDDMLLITGAFTGTYDSSKKEVAFKVGSTASAVTLKNFTATTFNVNGYDYGISGTKLVKK